MVDTSKLNNNVNWSQIKQKKEEFKAFIYEIISIQIKKWDDYDINDNDSPYLRYYIHNFYVDLFMMESEKIENAEEEKE